MYQSELSLDASLRGAYALLNSSLPSLSRAVRHDVQLRPIPQAAADLLMTTVRTTSLVPCVVLLLFYHA